VSRHKDLQKKSQLWKKYGPLEKIGTLQALSVYLRVDHERGGGGRYSTRAHGESQMVNRTHAQQS
jgi:hypothetical protein